MHSEGLSKMKEHAKTVKPLRGRVPVSASITKGRPTGLPLIDIRNKHWFKLARASIPACNQINRKNNTIDEDGKLDNFYA